MHNVVQHLSSYFALLVENCRRSYIIEYYYTFRLDDRITRELINRFFSSRKSTISEFVECFMHHMSFKTGLQSHALVGRCKFMCP